MNWINVKDRLPESNKDMVLSLVDNQIMMGRFNAIESWNHDMNGVKVNYVKYIYFEPCIWLSDHSCDECEDNKLSCCGNQCINCCEKDSEISNLIPTYGLDVVTYWMPLPKRPDEMV